MDDLIRQVAGTMALSGMPLTGEDKARIRDYAGDKSKIDAVVAALVAKHSEAPVLYDGILYQSAEAAYQSQRLINRARRMEFAKLDPVAAKRKGNAVKPRPDWDEIKAQKMYEIHLAKFTQHPDLAEKLLLTGNRPLEYGAGENMLGKILMRIREELRS